MKYYTNKLQWGDDEMKDEEKLGSVVIFVLITYVVYLILMVTGTVTAMEAWFSGMTTGLIILSLLGVGAAIQLFRLLKSKI